MLMALSSLVFYVLASRASLVRSQISTQSTQSLTEPVQTHPPHPRRHNHYRLLHHLHGTCNWRRPNLEPLHFLPHPQTRPRHNRASLPPDSLAALRKLVHHQPAHAHQPRPLIRPPRRTPTRRHRSGSRHAFFGTAGHVYG